MFIKVKNKQAYSCFGTMNSLHKITLYKISFSNVKDSIDQLAEVVIKLTASVDFLIFKDQTVS